MYFSTLQPAPAIASPDIQDPSPPLSDTRDSEEAPAVNDLTPDRNVHGPTLDTTGPQTMSYTVDDIHSEAIIDEATPVPDATASPPARDEEQEPSPPDPDTVQHGSPPSLPDIVVPTSSSQDANLDHSNGGHSSGELVPIFHPLLGTHGEAPAAAATSGEVPEAADTLAEPAAGSGQTGLEGAVASTHEPSSRDTRNEPDLPLESILPETMRAVLPVIRHTSVTGGQQATNSTLSSAISDARDTVGISGARDDEQTVETAYGELGRDAERVDDAEGDVLQFLDGGDDVVPRDGVEEEEDTRFD